MTPRARSKTYFGPTPLRAMCHRRSCQQYIFAKNIRISPIDGGLDVVELGNESMFQPVNDHLGKDDRKDRLRGDVHQSHCITDRVYLVLTESMVFKTPLPLNMLRGSKSTSDPIISIRFRPAINDNMRESENRSTISVWTVPVQDEHQCGQVKHVLTYRHT
jgi:hypothetical protein